MIVLRISNGYFCHMQAIGNRLTHGYIMSYSMNINIIITFNVEGQARKENTLEPPIYNNSQISFSSTSAAPHPRYDVPRAQPQPVSSTLPSSNTYGGMCSPYCNIHILSLINNIVQFIES